MSARDEEGRAWLGKRDVIYVVVCELSKKTVVPA